MVIIPCLSACNTTSLLTSMDMRLISAFEIAYIHYPPESRPTADVSTVASFRNRILGGHRPSPSNLKLVEKRVGSK